MRKNGRIVNVSSARSTLGGGSPDMQRLAPAKYSPNIQRRFRSRHKSLQDIETLIQEYEVGHYLFIVFLSVPSTPFILKLIDLCTQACDMN